jgi:hypothetical protein
METKLFLSEPLEHQSTREVYVFYQVVNKSPVCTTARRAHAGIPERMRSEDLFNVVIVNWVQLL